jgi:hypothetical protein
MPEIASKSDQHITILRRLTHLIRVEPRLEILFTTPDAGALFATLAERDPARPAISPGPSSALLIARPRCKLSPAAAWLEAGYSSEPRT